MNRKRFLLLLGLGLFLPGRPSLLAQDTKEAVPVTIVVVERFGAPIPHAQIKLSPQPATAPKNVETNEIGEISLDIIPGKYNLFVTAPLYNPWDENIEVEPRTDQTVRVTLQMPTIVHVYSGPLIQTSPIPEEPIGVLPLPPVRSLLLMQLQPPSGKHRSASTRKRRPENSKTPTNPVSSPSR